MLLQGGRHVDYVTDQLISKLLDIVKKKEKKSGVAIKAFQVMHTDVHFISHPMCYVVLTSLCSTYGRTVILVENIVSRLSTCLLVIDMNFEFLYI
jgi:hypothetical protein